MGKQQVSTRILDNGLTIVVQEMTSVQSAAMTILLPAGSVYDAPNRSGTAALLAEMLPRGAGGMDARRLSSALDNLGVQRSVAAGVSHITISSATTADRLLDTVPLVSAMVLSPQLDPDQFLAAQDLVRQALHALQDEPQQLLGRYLHRCSFAAPWNNPGGGTLEQIGDITCRDTRTFFEISVRPEETILGVAGNIRADEVFVAAEKQLGKWSTSMTPEIHEGPPEASPLHVQHDSAQTHIGLAWPAVPYSHEQYFNAWAAVSILSDGMSSRLFTRVRERRGLCYAISASLNTFQQDARVLGYAGTTNERAQETLDAMVSEIRSLHVDLTDDELRRCKAQAKSALIMQQESTTSRSAALARDYWHLGRVLLPDEIHGRIDRISVDNVYQYAVDYAPNVLTLVTLGPEALKTDCLKPQARLAT